MTLKEFFRRARNGRVWRVTPTGSVRCADGLCPMGAVAGERPVTGLDIQISWFTATARLDISLPTARRIARAADFRGSQDRKWLLKNLGVPA